MLMLLYRNIFHLSALFLKNIFKNIFNSARYLFFTNQNNSVIKITTKDIARKEVKQMRRYYYNKRNDKTPIEKSLEKIEILLMSQCILLSVITAILVRM